ncbi:hypothetical protein MAR_005250 [Mya arenaria]|uniref:Uncharacterized protein n=1 Tax=Mya arenaria TaxID=6604 RepID=A0ABY7F0M6_MYAAR|nr:hypothetical protein MAR_005250 [Mya arenaria]
MDIAIGYPTAMTNCTYITLSVINKLSRRLNNFVKRPMIEEINYWLRPFKLLCSGNIFNTVIPNRPIHERFR